MKTRRLAQTGDIRNVCIFCVNHGCSAASSAANPPRLRLRRDISTSRPKTSPATGAALREQDDSSQVKTEWMSESHLEESSKSRTPAREDPNFSARPPVFATRGRNPNVESLKFERNEVRTRFGGTRTSSDSGVPQEHHSQNRLKEQLRDGTSTSPSFYNSFPNGEVPHNNQNSGFGNRNHEGGYTIRFMNRPFDVSGVNQNGGRHHWYDQRNFYGDREATIAASSQQVGEATSRSDVTKNLDSQWGRLRRRSTQEISSRQKKDDGSRRLPGFMDSRDFRNSLDGTISLPSRAKQNNNMGYIGLRRQRPHIKGNPGHGDNSLDYNENCIQNNEHERQQQRHDQSYKYSARASEFPQFATDMDPDNISNTYISPQDMGESRIAPRISDRFVTEDIDTALAKRERHQRRRRFARQSKLEDEDGVDEDKLQARREQKRIRKQQKAALQPTPILLPPFISVSNLATALKVRAEKFIKKLEDLGFEDVQQDHVLNSEDAGLIAMEYGFEPMTDNTNEEEDLKALPAVPDKTHLPHRPPVITIMGHVDHGKTTLLDYLRKSSVAASEHGGITQHIGAFSVQMSSGKTITFLDTPGHEAFLSMRERGANVTDVVVLVVAADDSVKPQTIEAIKHAKAAQVPIIVAINKMDKSDADPIRVRQDLARHGVEVEDYGGDVQAVEVSGKTGQGMGALEEAVALQAEVLDMRADTDGPAEGWIIEATKGKAGRMATVLVKRGTLRPGNIIVAGEAWGRVRTLSNEAGQRIHEAPPGTPVAVEGWRSQPVAGDEVLQAPSEQKAAAVVALRCSRADRLKMTEDLNVINEQRRLNDERHQREKQAALAAKRARRASAVEEVEEDESADSSGPKLVASTSDSAVMSKTYPSTLHFLIKADVSGSLEAVQASVLSIPLQNQPLQISILTTGIGPITESDIARAAAVPRGTAHIVAFNVPRSPQIAQLAEQSGVKVLEQNIIYRLVDEVRSTLEANLPPLVSKRVTGEAEVGKVFEIGLGGRKTMKIAGCRVRNGTVLKGGRARVFRGVNVGDETGLVYDGFISSLKNVKKDVSEMRKGTECGIAFADWQGLELGDQIQCYEEKTEQRKLS